MVVASASWSTAVDLTAAAEAAAAGRRVVVDHGGRPVAVVPIEDLELLERIEDASDLAAVAEALAEPGAIPYDEVRRRLGLG